MPTTAADEDGDASVSDVDSSAAEDAGEENVKQQLNKPIRASKRAKVTVTTVATVGDSGTWKGGCWSACGVEDSIDD